MLNEFNIEEFAEGHSCRSATLPGERTSERTPQVSILLPTRNSMTFLKERVNSILAQTFQDWEVIIADSDSIDGTRKYLQEWAAKDSRVHFFTVPKGLYQAWNFCIKKAQGKYIYIATSDDMMGPDCLKKMEAALEQNPECDLCDSRLMLIDEHGNEITEHNPLYLPHHWHFTYPRDRQHIRLAPHDYYLHLGGKTVYTSITQILIRRTLFQKTGLFPTDFGCSADYLWGMRAAYHANVVYLPESLASWRLHSKQETAISCAKEIDTRFHQMTQMAQTTLSLHHDPRILAEVKNQIKLIRFKELLLPAKRKFGIFIFLKSLIGAIILFPGYSFLFLWFAILNLGKTSRKFHLIYTYDTLFRFQIKKLNLDRFIRLPTNETEHQ